MIQRNHIKPLDNEKGRANDEMYIVLFCNTFVSLIDFKNYKKISIGGDDVHYDGGNYIPEAFYEVQWAWSLRNRNNIWIYLEVQKCR